MATTRPATGNWLPVLQRYQGLVGLVLLLGIAFLLVRGTFFSGQNASNILEQLAVPGILAVGMTFVILTGGIDLSVGSLLGLLNCVIATWLVSGRGVMLSAGYGLAVGAAIGALIGLIISLTRMQPFVVTLAAYVSLRGAAYVYTNNNNVSGLGGQLHFLMTGVAGLPVAAWLMLCVTAVAAIVLGLTRFGRHIYALGGNYEAARLSGVPVVGTRVAAYAVNGLCVAIAALVFTARTTNGDPSGGVGYELDAITAVVVGGSSLLGGYGNVLGTFVGALFIACLQVLLILKGVNTYVGWGWKGIIILIAVYLQNLGRR